MKNLIRLTLPGLLFLTACGGLTTSDKPVTRTWMLMPMESSSGSAASAEVTTIELSVVVVPGLDTDKILTLSSDAELNNFTGARWAEHTPELLESLLARSLQGTARYEVVANQADCDLHLEVQEFYAYTGSSGVASEVRIQIDGQYSCGSENSKRLHLQESVPVHEDRMSAIVASFQSGVNKVMSLLLAGL